VLTFTGAVGMAGWEAIVYTPEGTTSDSPLPLALQSLGSNRQWPYQVIVLIGLFGLVASFNGIILAAGRSSFEFGRVKFAPAFIGKISSRFRTPANALLVNMTIGIIALLTGKTGEIITISVFGALTLYIFSMVALLKLRKNEPDLPRPFRVPLYPWFPIVALVIASVSLVALTVYNFNLSLIYFALMGISFGIFKLAGGGAGAKAAAK
jgi:ethanolamine permease